MGRSVEGAQVREIEIKDVALTIRSFLNGIVVENDGVPIATHMHIKLNRINGQRKSITKGSQRILWSEVRATPMGNALKMRCHGIFKTSLIWSDRFATSYHAAKQDTLVCGKHS
jgi:hypothetical protein